MPDRSRGDRPGSDACSTVAPHRQRAAALHASQAVGRERPEAGVGHRLPRRLLIAPRSATRAGARRRTIGRGR